jgi:ABC-type sugar transport system ATPase subunit
MSTPAEGRNGTGAGFAIRAASHEYSGVVVLRDVDFAIRPGEIQALVGQNGSGKSTLIKILTGALRPSAGSLALDGEPVSFSSPDDARRHGIGVVHQDYHLFPDLTVAECVFGVNKRPPRHRYTRMIDRGSVDRQVTAVFDRLGIHIATRRLVKTLAPAERKFVEIARAMIMEPRVLILDEATAAFEPAAARGLLELMRRLADSGLGICFVSHRLDEVLRVSDRITVLRDGRLIGELDRETAAEDRLVRMLLGGERGKALTRRSRPGPSPVLRVTGTRVSDGKPPVDLDVHPREIVGLVGLLGSGAARLVRMIGGAEPLPGNVEVSGRQARIHSPRDASRLGIGFIPEDRKGCGLVGDLSVAANVSLASLPRVCGPRGVLRKKRLLAAAEEYREAMGIRTATVNAPVRTLSGGNQQKVMIAKWLASGVQVLAIEEPTHGVDVNGKVQIHNLLRQFTERGGAIVLASTDVPEVVALCDRIVVFRHGAITQTMSLEEQDDVARRTEHVVESLISSAPEADSAAR